MTDPVLAPFGTGATTLVVLQLPGVVGIPLNATILPLLVDPKFDPLIVTDVPDDPEVGERLLILGAGTVNINPLLACAATVTTTLPVVAPAGTGATILVLVQLVGAVTIPLNATVLVP